MQRRLAVGGVAGAEAGAAAVARAAGAVAWAAGAVARVVDRAVAGAVLLARWP